MAAYPTFAAGEVAHLPFQQGIDFANVTTDMPHGWRYAYNLIATGLKTWAISYSFSDADRATFEAFWVAQKGKLSVFDFTDPQTGVTHTKCRFDMDAAEFQTVGPNEHIINVKIKEYA
jgi:hypothetical protein